MIRYLELCRWPEGYRCDCSSTRYLCEINQRRAVFTCWECGRSEDVLRIRPIRALAAINAIRTAALVCAVYRTRLDHAPPRVAGVLFHELSADGLSCGEIAKAFGCDPGVVSKTRYEKCRREVRRERRRQHG